MQVIVTETRCGVIYSAKEALDLMWVGGSGFYSITQGELHEINEFARKHDLDVMMRLVTEVVLQQEQAVIAKAQVKQAKQAGYRNGMLIGFLISAAIGAIGFLTHETPEVQTTTAALCQSAEAPGYTYSCLYSADGRRSN